MTRKEGRYNKILQLVRSPIERCFARLHSWGVIRFTQWRNRKTDLLVEVVMRIEQHFNAPHHTRWTRDYNAEDWRMGNIATTPAQVTASALNNPIIKHLDLRGKNSARRAKAAPAKKAGKLKLAK